MSTKFSRRNALKMGLEAGLGATTALYAPAVLSSDAPVIRYLGTAVNMGDEIEKKLFEDTGIKVQYISKTTDEVTKSVLTQPNSFDIVDSEYFSLPKLVPSGNILGMDTTRIKEWDNVTSIFTKGITPGGKKVGLQGTAPSKVMYLTGATSGEFADDATQYATLIPTVYNADTLGILSLIHI